MITDSKIQCDLVLSEFKNDYKECRALSIESLISILTAMSERITGLEDQINKMIYVNTSDH